MATFASLFGRLAFDCPKRGGGVIDFSEGIFWRDILIIL